MARIFARELNSSEDLTQKGEISKAILRGEDLDVIEIDGASNRGVQEARDLIAASVLAPTRCKYRIYIIDEVHMLTTPAFNALLKTMEEPPSHVKFILCTTEPHKVPATIQSRCQRFDFRSIPSAKIAAHLDFILREEGIDAAPEVVAQVARLGNGSMRDALSILDRLLAGGVGAIKVDEMEEMLGLPSQVAVTRLCDAVSNKDIQGALESADALLLCGISLDRVLEVVALTFRNALISKVCGAETELLELSDDARTSSTRIGDCFDEATLTHLIALCDASSRQVRRGGSGRALFDATIARLCLVGEVAEAGSVLTSNTSSGEIKKKSIEHQVSHPPIVETVSELPVEESSSALEVNWDILRSLISKTAGLKKITKYLVFSSFEDQRLTLSISDSGRDSVNYILAQRQKIEQMLTKELGIKFQVIIDASQQTGPSVAIDSSFDEVEEDELVKAARGLFDGTIINVRNNEKDGH